LHNRNALDIHAWLQSYEARMAGKKAKALPKPIPPVWRGPSCAFTTAHGIYEWTRDDDKVRPIQPFRAPKTEQQIAELYCAPRAYCRSVEFLLEAPAGLFTSDQLNKPEKWLNALSKYLALTRQGEVSLAAKQLHRLVEEARKEFRESQDRAWGNRKLANHPPEDFERREAAAWEKFSKLKQALLHRYNLAINTGVVKRVRRNKAQICPICETERLFRPRQRKCDECRIETRHQRNRRYNAGLKNRVKTGSLLGIRGIKTVI